MTAPDNPLNITILGSTGSIGTQTLDIVRRFPSRFRVAALTAGSNWQLLAEQALEFRPKVAVIAHEEYYPRLEEALKGSGIQPAAGEEAICWAATLDETEMVVGALVGFSGFRPTIEALDKGKKLALANKETLVVAGEIIDAIVKRTGNEILPVDSEHSAIFQCLRGEERRSLRKILLTASGGPFRTFSKEQLETATLEQTLAHPNWSMGAKVTVDSATMINKGFEMIEARWLFGCNPSDIQVLVHPQSIIHSMVEFCDGSVKAQLAIPDMRLPIGYALSYPYRLPMPEMKAPDFADIATLTFEQPDTDRFPLLALAYRAIETGGTATTILNAANEVAVKAFLQRKISFMGIPRLVEKTMSRVNPRMEVTLETIQSTHDEATAVAHELLSAM